MFFSGVFGVKIVLNSVLYRMLIIMYRNCVIVILNVCSGVDIVFIVMIVVV